MLRVEWLDWGQTGWKIHSNIGDMVSRRVCVCVCACRTLRSGTFDSQIFRVIFISGKRDYAIEACSSWKKESAKQRDQRSQLASGWQDGVGKIASNSKPLTSNRRWRLNVRQILSETNGTFSLGEWTYLEIWSLEAMIHENTSKREIERLREHLTSSLFKQIGWFRQFWPNHLRVRVWRVRCAFCAIGITILPTLHSGAKGGNGKAHQGMCKLCVLCHRLYVSGNKTT